MEDLYLAVALGLQWAERLKKLNQMILDARDGKKIDFAALQAEDDAGRASFQSLIDAKKTSSG